MMGRATAILAALSIVVGCAARELPAPAPPPSAVGTLSTADVEHVRCLYAGATLADYGPVDATPWADRVRDCFARVRVETQRGPTFATGASMASDRRNGDDAHRLANLPVVPVSTVRVTEREAVVHYATIAIGYNDFAVHELPKIRKDLEAVRGTSENACTIAAQARDAVVATQEQVANALVLVEEIREHLMPGKPKPRHAIPPMRGPLDTQTVFVDTVAALVQEKVAELASETPGPLVEAPPQQIAEVVRDIVEPMLARREERKEYERLRSKDEAERHALLKVAEERRSFLRGVAKMVIGGVLTAAAIATGTYLVGTAKGHADGVVEGRNSAPSVVVPVPAPVFPLATATAFVAPPVPVAAPPVAPAPRPRP